jgi:hypothetical protein
MFIILVFALVSVVNAQNKYTIEDVYLSDSIKVEIKKQFFKSLNKYKKGFNVVVMDTNFQKATQQHADYLMRQNESGFYLVDKQTTKSNLRFITHNREYYANGVFIENFIHHVKVVTDGKYYAKGECILMDSYDYFPELKKYPELYKPKQYTVEEWAEILLNRWLNSPEHKKILMDNGNGYISFSFEKEKETDWDNTNYYTYHMYAVYIVCD